MSDNKKLTVRKTAVIKFASRVKKVWDNRLGDPSKNFVRIMLSNGTFLDIPTDCGPQMLALADTVSAVRGASDLNKAVLDQIGDYIVENGNLAVQTGIKPNTYRLLADDENLSKPGQSGLEREVVTVKVVEL